MLILTEKPSVANDFAQALNCPKNAGYFSDGKIEIAYCVGHLFKLHEPDFYEERFKSWKEIPCIPKQFSYAINESVNKQAELVLALLKKHKLDEILIATDADREGEIIARECLNLAGIFDFSKIKRFWVSQALTKEVIFQGIKEAKPLAEYNQLAKNGFARQHSDWLTGMNFTRYVSVAANKKLSIGRIKTALLSAIDSRCSKIENFQSEKYFEFYASFGAKRFAPSCKGIYFEVDKNNSSEIKTGFSDNSRETMLKSCIGKTAKLIDSKTEKKISNPPLLYNLNALQKDAFKYFGYTADKTLKITQSLYEQLKCISYPRTPSRVMGSKNVELCKNVAETLSKRYSYFESFFTSMQISLSNKRCFNDAKLEAHHALIPLKKLPTSATQEQEDIYYLIFDRFFEAFLPPCEWEKQTYILNIDSAQFRIVGKKTLVEGFKSNEFQHILTRSKQERNIDLAIREAQKQDSDELEEIQSLENINWNNLICTEIKAKEKYTKPPKYFNEASILSFMENPTSLDENNSKLVGLGTAATRHTFIPELIANGYIKIEKKNILITQLGRVVINSVRNSSIKTLANIEETTRWETFLEENPIAFEEEIKSFIKTAVTTNFKIELPADENQILCPVCKNPLRLGTTKTGIKNWYCTGYKNGCSFKIWEQFNGIKLSQKDIILLCSNKKTSLKNFVSKKTGKEFKAHLYLDSNHEIKFDFNK